MSIKGSECCHLPPRTGTFIHDVGKLYIVEAESVSLPDAVLGAWIFGNQLSVTRIVHYAVIVIRHSVCVDKIGAVFDIL